MSVLVELFQEYEQLVAKADNAFQEVAKDYGSEIKCDIGCSDCCSAVFGLFLIESAYLNYKFNQLDNTLRETTLSRAVKSDNDLLNIEKKYSGNPELIAKAISKERIRCPLLLQEQQKCMLYASRPITCRVYGIPTIINGQIHYCWKQGFKRDKSYPAFDLDAMYKELYSLSQRLLEKTSISDIDKASLLVSVSKSIKTPIDEIIDEL